MLEHFPRQFGKYVLLRSLARGGMGELYLAGSAQGAGLAKLCVIKRVISRQAETAEPAEAVERGGRAERGEFAGRAEFVEPEEPARPAEPGEVAELDAGADAGRARRPDGARHASKVNRFLDEAKVVLRLSHANLVTTFDAGEVDGESFIAMEQVEGKDLREVWNRCVRTRTRIPLDVALIVAREVARALGYVHAYGDLRLVHRDVAPPNIMLSYFGEVKLTDFGLARSTLKKEHTTPGVVFGRASYLSPEQARGEVADARTDVYSLGIVTWELLTGQPYLQLAGLDPVSSLALVRNPRPDPPSTRAPWITPDLDTVVMRALAPERRNRYGSAEEFRRGLSEVMARVAPRADSDRVAEFLRGLYLEVIAEERAERDRLIGEVLPRFLGEAPQADDETPTTGVVVVEAPAGAFTEVADDPPGALILDAARSGSGRHWQAPAAHLQQLQDDAARARASAPTVPSPLLAAPEAGGDAAAIGRHPSADVADADADVDADAIVVADDVSPEGSGQTRGGAGETLHASALRARADFRVRRLPDDPAGSDVPTDVWAKREGRSAAASSPHRTDGGGGRDTGSGSGGGLGQIIDGRYRIRRRIGEGGMGTVYAAEHVEIGKSVAVKILHPQYSGDEQLVERFRREAQAASRVGHPNIIDVTDFGTTEDDCAYFVMELLDGMDLADVLAREHRFGPERAVRIAVQVCRALQAAHEVGIIHRDLKPENIFLVARDGETDFVKVLDFGIAQNLAFATGRLTHPGMAMGTPEYMAPEQALAGPVDGRTDVYALGALTYEMLMGIAPHKEGPPDGILERKMKPPDSLRALRPEVSPGLDAVIRQALDADPDRRPQTMSQLEYELTKTVWGRGKAVAEMLGLRVEERPHVETPAPVTSPPELGVPAPPTERQPRVTSSSIASLGASPGAPGEGGAPPGEGGVPPGEGGVPPGGGGVPLGEGGVPLGEGGVPLGMLAGSGEPSARSAAATPPRLPSPPPSPADPLDERVETRSGAGAQGGLAAQVRSPSPSPQPPPPAALPAPATALPASGPTAAPSPVSHPPSHPSASSSPVTPASEPAAGRHLARAPARRRLPSALGLGAAACVIMGLVWWSSRATPHHPAESLRKAARHLEGLARRRPEVAPIPPSEGRGRASAAVRLRAPGRRVGPEPGHPGPLVPRGGLALTGLSGGGAEGPTTAAAARVLPPQTILLPSRPLPATASPQGSSSPGGAAAPGGPAFGIAAISTRPPEVVLTSPSALQRARDALAAGAPGDAVAALRAMGAPGRLGPDERSLLVDALVAAGWQEARVYHWQSANRKAREALAETAPAGQPSRGAHALLGEGLYALGDFRAALDEFNQALAESPRDARLKRRVIRSKRRLQERSPSVASEPAAEQ
jgi:serine/threonine protein kinase